MNWLVVDKIIENAFLEDMPFGDATTEALIDKEKNSTVDIIQKEDGVICGTEVFERVYKKIGDTVYVKFYVSDGDFIKAGTVIGEAQGTSRELLSGERTALNIMQRMSGVASLTRLFTDKLKGTSTKLLNTRKTTPGLRILEKYATEVGGAVNHRYCLSDGILIKDNHIKAVGSIKEAIVRARESMSFVRKIEVETETLEEVKEAVDVGADIIMLDNMDLDTMKDALAIIKGRAVTEVSGNVTLDNIGEIAKVGVDYISTGYITHSYKALDISMKNFRYI
jgi:nicotinate-nucleotide pyrophosphorylase